MKTEHQLLPCPFCGSTENPVQENRSYFNSVERGSYFTSDYYLECETCDLTIGKGQNADQWGDIDCAFATADAAAAFWNKRSNL